MAGMEIVKMSAKGQLVVPESIRTAEGFEPGDRFVPVSVKGGVLFQRVDIPDVKERFAALADELERQMKRRKIPVAVVDEAVKWARKKS